MNTVDFQVKDKKYELRLTTRNIIRLEKELKKNPLSIFMRVEEDILPTTEELVLVLYYSLLACHESEFKNIDNVFSLFDEYIEEGGSSINLIPILLEVFQISGIIPKVEEEAEKN